MADWLRSWLDPGVLWYYARAVAQLLILWFLIYRLLAALERISAGGKLRGLSVALLAVAAAAVIARAAELHAITWLLQASISLIAIAIAVVFAPELRRLLTRMGGFLASQDMGGSARVIGELVDALAYMADRRIGALIVIERSDRLDDYVNTSPLDCDVTSKSVCTIFWKDSPLHDGAVIVRDGRIAAAGVILPLTENVEYKHLPGTRHRAGIGISEDTDAFAVLVSEETGTISIADRGRLTRGLSRADLEAQLTRLLGAARRSKTTWPAQAAEKVAP